MFVNKYVKPTEFYWPLLSFWWSFHGSIWIDRVLIPLAGLLIVASLVGATVFGRRTRWGTELLIDPVFGACILAAGGYIVFMTYQNHPQPRYFAVVAVFCFLIVAMATQALIAQHGSLRLLGWGAAGLTVIAIAVNGAQTVSFAAHPEYTFVTAARSTRGVYRSASERKPAAGVDQRRRDHAAHSHAVVMRRLQHAHPEFPDLGTKLAVYKPGWWATWNDIDPGTLEDIHTHYSLEQVAEFRAFDDPERNVLVLFKLHPLPGGQARLIKGNNLQRPLPDDKILIPIE